jgi:hypothetical protein
MGDNYTVHLIQINAIVWIRSIVPEFFNNEGGVRAMPGKLIDVSPSAYPYPLLIKHLLHYPMVHAPDQEIVYRDLRRQATGCSASASDGSQAGSRNST